MATIDATGYDTIVSPHWYIISIYNVYLHSRKYALMVIYIYDEADTFISAWGLGLQFLGPQAVERVTDRVSTSFFYIGHH